MSRSSCILSICGLLVAVSVGCGSSGPKLYPATGTVTYEGKPVDGASVLFIPQEGRPCTGTTDASGKFTVMTGSVAGAAKGTYIVTVNKEAGSGSTSSAIKIDGPPTPEQQQKMQEEMARSMREYSAEAKKQKPVLPVKYTLPQSSDLSVTVTDDPAKNNFDLVLKP